MYLAVLLHCMLPELQEKAMMIIITDLCIRKSCALSHKLELVKFGFPIASDYGCGRVGIRPRPHESALWELCHTRML
jgi:hypothetical protein